MSEEKEPLTDEEFDRILQAAIRRDGRDNNQKAGEREKIVLILRYTGMHVSILVDPEKYNLHIEDGLFIVWNRTKKEGKEAHTLIPINKTYITFNVEKFINDLKKRRRKNSRQYFYNLVKDVGERAGIKNLSPMSLRHTFAVSLLDLGCSDAFVRQNLNCSRKILETYTKYSKNRSKDVWKRIGWY